MKNSFVPYTGPAGPTEQQAENNTLELAVLLVNLNIPFKEDMEYAFELWGSLDLNLKLSNKGKTIFVGYDRWGFCIDGEYDGDGDQLSLEETLECIKEFMKLN